VRGFLPFYEDEGRFGSERGERVGEEGGGGMREMEGGGRGRAQEGEESDEWKRHGERRRKWRRRGYVRGNDGECRDSRNKSGA
jgi:hypothetical protein